MRIAWWVGAWGGCVAIACGPGLKYPDAHDVGRQTLLDASGNADEFAKLLRGSVMDGGVWFDNPTCATQFQPGEISADRLVRFASCLAELHLQLSPREDALGDVVVMTYPPGFEVEARVVNELSGPRLSWIGYEARKDDRDSIPTISPATLESLRLAGDRNGPLDPTIANTLELDLTPKAHAAFTWLKVCIDTDGTVTDANPRETTSTKASAAFAAAASAWKFRPFTIQGQALPVCAMVRMAYPPDAAPPVETLPLPPPPSSGKKEPIVFADGAMRKFTDAKRIAGDRNITPDDRTKEAIYLAKVSKIISSFRICLDETGHVESVLPIRSTGIATYDRELIAGMRQWVYSPFIVDDQPYPVCTAVTFVYNQR